MIPIPPLNLSVPVSSSAQSGARSDSYQGGVQINQGPFGDFNVVGGGTQSAPALTTSASVPKIVATQAANQSTGINPLVIGGVILAGVAVWYLLKTKQKSS